MTTEILTAQQTGDFHEQVRKGKRVLSYSQIATFLSCPHKWYLTYYLGIHTRTPPGPMVLGDATHQAIAHCLEFPDVTPEEFIRDWAQRQLGKRQDSGDDNLHSIFEAMTNATDELATNAIHATRLGLDRLKREGFTVFQWGERPAIELELRVDIPFAPAFDHFASHIDLIAEHKATGRLWQLDYKIRRNFSSNQFEEVNLQAMIYNIMCLFHGLDRLTGTGTLEIKSERPQDPAFNKDGSLSRAKIATTWEHYEQFALRHGLNPFEYDEMRHKLRSVEWTRLTQEFRSPQQLQQVWDKIVCPTATLMSDIMLNLDERLARAGFNNGPPHNLPLEIKRNMSQWNCNGCSVREVCVAGLYDRDIEHIISSRDHRRDIMRAVISLGLF